MFPDIARDDVFRLETKRLWLRWPRVADAKAIERYSSRLEVAKMTARIPHPYPPGEAERFIFTAREANAVGRDLILVIAPIRGKREPVGMISLESRLQGRLTLGYALAPEVWGKGLATEAALAAIDAGFSLTSAVEALATAHIENPASRRVLEKCGFVHSGTGLEGAPARGGMVPCDRFRLERLVWASGRVVQESGDPRQVEGQRAPL
jgi:RimJ/RimL family protein N-acetyltransferase